VLAALEKAASQEESGPKEAVLKNKADRAPGPIPSGRSGDASGVAGNSG